MLRGQEVGLINSWNPKIDGFVEQLEAGGHDANYRQRLSVNRDALTNEVRVSAELIVPKFMAENGDWRSAGLIFFRSEGASICRTNTGRAKEVAGNMCPLHEHRTFLAHDSKTARRVSGDRIERLLLIAQVRETGIRESCLSAPAPRVRFPEHHQPL